MKYTHPDGSAEHAQQAFTAGMRWCSVITADTYTVADWRSVIDKHRAYGIRVGAGGRVYNPGEIRGQIRRAHEGELGFVFLNVEGEFQSTLPPPVVNAEIRGACVEFGFPLDQVWLNTVGWLYNNVDYTPVAWMPTALQVYWEDMHHSQQDLERLLDDCFDHAHQKGFRDLQPTFLVERSDPQHIGFWRGKPRSYFTGNSLGSQNWPKGWWV